jgi:YVTN family beta-propeller protein
MKPGSTELWIACVSGGISVFDTVTGTVTRTIITGVGGLNGLSFTADGATVYSTFRTTVAVPTNPVAGIVAVDTASGTATGIIADPDAGSGPLLSPDGSTILVAHWGSHSLGVIDTASGTVTSTTVPMGGLPDAGVLNPAGTAAYYCVDGARIVVVDLASRSVVRTLPVACGQEFTSGSSLAFADPNTLYGVSPEAGVSVIDVPTGTVTAALPRGSMLEQVEGQAAFVQTDALAPAVAALSPSQGPEAGANKVVITGGPFIDVAGVSFGGVPATAYRVDSETQITAVVPAQTFRTVDVSVTDVNGTSAVGPPDLYTYVLPPPTISSMVPNSGVSSGGTTVVITGTDLTTTQSVYFGGTAASSFTIDSDTQITAVTRAQTNGTVNVSVRNAAGVNTSVPASQFTFFSPVPVVTAVSPSTGPSAGGTTVTITGIRFTGTFRVMFGGVAVPYTLNSATQITVVTPPWSSLMAPATGTTGSSGPGNTVDVQVTTDVDTSAISAADQYDYATS